MLASMAGYMIAIAISCSAGLLLGALLAGSRIGALYDRLETAEAANRAQAELLDELTAALRPMIDRDAIDFEGRGEMATARRLIERVATAVELTSRDRFGTRE